jgi:hypothetical protein
MRYGVHGHGNLPSAPAFMLLWNLRTTKGLRGRDNIEEVAKFLTSRIEGEYPFSNKIASRGHHVIGRMQTEMKTSHPAGTVPAKETVRTSQAIPSVARFCGKRKTPAYIAPTETKQSSSNRSMAAATIE